ncbi:MAG: DNA alkylation repair protein [Clostridiales bacterium]|nr:DNA alkylation repair protein [Clostridiales bacterium]
MNYETLSQILRENSNKTYDEFNNTVINSKVPTIGCTLPFMRKLAKSFSVEEVESLPVHSFYEVDLLRGIVVSNANLPFEEKSVYLLSFAKNIENWAVCDCSTVKVSKAECEKYFEFFLSLLPNEQPFVCRYGVVNLLSNYLDDEHIVAVFSAFETITQWGHYYVDMAVAWLVATAMVKCRDATVAYMKGEGRQVLNKFAYNKALQKMRESYRVSPEDKQWTYTMKMQ